jgi:cytochrome c553
MVACSTIRASTAEFKEGDRENDVYSRMRVVAEALTEEEIEALADYFAIPEPPEE